MIRHWLVLLFGVYCFSAPALADQSYGKRLSEHLNKFKKYPASANARHASGETRVTFSVDREGKIISSSVVKSSGELDLDQASLEMLIKAQPFPPFPADMTNNSERFTVPVIFRSSAAMESTSPDIDLSAFMMGKCKTLKIAGRDFTCKSMSYFHTKRGRANFTIVVDDPADDGHVIAFSGENGRKIGEDLYELPIDRMLLNSKDRPKIGGLPVPSVELSAGICKQLGDFSARQVSGVTCTAMDRNGKQYELKFEPDGSPITVKGQDERVSQQPPAIAQKPELPKDSTPPSKPESLDSANESQNRPDLAGRSYLGKWYTNDSAACAGDLPEGGGLVEYTAREVLHYETGCRVTKSVTQGSKTDLTMRCYTEGTAHAALDHEIVEVVGDKLKRTIREGRKQRTFTYNRCPSESVSAGGNSRAGMTVTENQNRPEKTTGKTRQKTTSIELTKLITLFLLPRSRGEVVIPWTTASDHSTPIDWQHAGIKDCEPAIENLYQYVFCRTGEVTLTSEGKPSHLVLGKTVQPGRWTIRMIGPHAGAMVVTVESNESSGALDANFLSKSINRNSSIGLKRGKRCGGESTGTERFEFSGKTTQTVYGRQDWSCGSGGCSIQLLFAINPDDVKLGESCS